MGIDAVPPSELPDGVPKDQTSTSNDFALRLAAYHKAIEEEFTTVEAAIQSGETEEIASAARTLLLSKTAVAARTIAYLAENADSESVRMNCSKYILDNALGEKGLAKPTDPLAKLVEELRGNDPSPAPIPNTDTPG